MKRKTKFAIGILLSSAVFVSSVSVGLSAWVSIDMKHDSTPVQKRLYTVVLKDGADDANPTRIEGLERNSFFELRPLPPKENDYRTFEGWKEENGSTVYLGTVSLASFASLPDNTLTLYSSWIIEDAFIQVNYASQTPQTTRLHLQDPYIFPLFNLHPSFTGLTKITSYTYANTDKRAITYRRRSSDSSGYESVTSSDASLFFNPNDSLILTDANFSEISLGQPIVLTVA